MKELREVVLNFMDTFNRADLEAALACMSEDAVYIDEFGVEHLGHKALRGAFGPILDGSYGRLTYRIEDTIFDDANEQALVTWVLDIENDDQPLSRMRGLDIIRVEGEHVSSKNCYMKSKEVLIESAA